jgi:biopolymer transport protein ExbD
MGREKKRKEEEYFNGNLTAMIDVVFQLIIFFVCTVKLQDDNMDARIKLAYAPHGKVVVKKDPRQVTIDVDNKGRASIGRFVMSPAMVYTVMAKVYADAKGSVPVVIRGDLRAKHSDIRQVMDQCTRAGHWQIEFSAFKEEAGKKKVSTDSGGA